MPDKVVSVPGVGNVAFPDTMSDDDIAAQIKKNTAPTPAAGAAQSGSQPGAPPEQPGMLSRFAHGVYDTTVGPAAHAIAHPIDTLTALGKQAIGKDDLDAVANSVKTGDYKGAALNLGKWAMGRTPEGMALKTGYGLIEPTVDAARQGDIPTAAGRATGTGLLLAAPALGGADSVADSAAQGLTKSALKGGYTVNTPAADVDSAVSTMRGNQVPLTAGGQAKIGQALDDLRQSIQGKVNDAASNGVKVDPRKVVDRLDDMRSKYQTQVNPTQDLRDIDQVRKNFLDQHTITTPGQAGQPAVTGMTGQTLQQATPATPAATRTVPIPADEAQAIKVGSNTLNADKYGKVSTAQVEAEKALTRGIKEELEAQIPELGSLNASQQKLMGLDEILGKAVNKYRNSEGFLGDVQRAGASANVFGTATSAMRAVLANPVVKARLATAIDTARKLNPGKFAGPAITGAAKVQGLMQGLATPQASDQQQQPQQQ